MKRITTFIVLSLSLFAQASFVTPRPKVPILAWDVPVKDMVKWKARGVNVLIGAGMEGKKDQAELDSWAKAAEDNGLWVIVDPKLTKRYPNLYACLLPDEMDAKQSSFKPNVERWDGWTPAQIKPLYDAFKLTNPNLPVFMSCSGAKITGGNRLDYYKSIAPFCDMWMSDGYPRNMNASRYDEALWPGKATSILKQAAPDKPVVSMIEVDDQNLWNSPLGRGPTPDEVREAIWQAKANGANGFGVFSHYFSDGTGGWAGWDRTTAEVAAVLVDEFLKLNPPEDPEVAALKTRLKQLEKDNEDFRPFREWLMRVPGAVPLPTSRPTTNLLPPRENVANAVKSKTRKTTPATLLSDPNQPAPAPATKPVIVPARLARGASLIVSAEGAIPAADIGMTRAVMVSPATIWWGAWDVEQLRKVVGDAELISVNFEGSSDEVMGDGRADAENRNAAALVAKRLKWVRQSYPDRIIDWNTAPVVLPLDIARWKRTEATYNAYRVANDAVREFVLNGRITMIGGDGAERAYKLLDSVSVQVYFNRLADNGSRENWRKYAAWSVEGLQPWGLPIRLMVNPGYEWQSIPGYRGKWVTGADQDGLLFDLDAIGLPVIWWGTVTAGGGEWVEGKSKPATWAEMRKSPELARVAGWSNKQRE